jgi:ubiquinone/menaquinone biosynthesis C-methylase UbiE
MENPLHKHGRFFDVWASFYRLTIFGLELRRIQRNALKRLGVVSGERVLDLGCGPGDGASRLTEKQAIAIGLDYSQGMLDTAKKEPRLRGRLTRGDAGRLPFRDGAFDKIVCTNSFHHYPDHVASLKEMRRVLRPGGLLVLVDPRQDNLFGRLAIEVVEERVFGLKEVRIFPIARWHELLKDAGFSHAKIESGPIWQPVAWAEAFIEATA